MEMFQIFDFFFTERASAVCRRIYNYRSVKFWKWWIQAKYRDVDDVKGSLHNGGGHSKKGRVVVRFYLTPYTTSSPFFEFSCQKTAQNMDNII